LMLSYFLYLYDRCYVSNCYLFPLQNWFNPQIGTLQKQRQKTGLNFNLVW
jgi:hypothetical protein